MQMQLINKYKEEWDEAQAEFDRVYLQEHAKAGLRLGKDIDHTDLKPLPSLSPESKRKIMTAREKYEEAHKAYEKYLAGTYCI